MKDRLRQISKLLIGQFHFVRVIRIPTQSFIHTEEIGSFILLLASAAALIWANFPWSDSYADFWDITISFDFHILAISEDLRHVVNDGLMAVFFFLVGLEIKRELVHGELSSFRKAAVPALAAVGGMAMPALIFLLFNRSGEGTVGWGIPMATDIAFALGALALLGRRVPAELRVFLLGLAVVDDLGAIAVIALFYTDTIHWTDLGLGIAMLGVIAACIRIGVRSLGFYIILSVLMWQFFLESGIHATLAGVLLAAIIPSEPYVKRKDYADAVEELLHDFRTAMANGDEEKAQGIAEQIEKLSSGTEGPVERLEGIVHPWVSYIILPIFALANAGIIFTTDTLSEAISSRITLGIGVALLAGNAIGVFGMTWLAVRLGIGQLPSGVTWGHVLGVAFLAGIGFTVAIFISGIAFDDPALVNQAKMGIFFASALAGVTGYLFLRITSARTSEARTQGNGEAQQGREANLGP